MHPILIAFVFLALTLSAAAFDIPGPDLNELIDPPVLAADRVDRLMKQIRDGQLATAVARRMLVRELSAVRDDYYRRGGRDVPRSGWVFPVEGRDRRAITGGRRHGYQERGYDFYTGNRHGGHPSLDIFIRDRNRDCRDDQSGKPVSVLSMTAGIVVSAETEWREGSRLRGGKYLWVYDPGNDLLVYYAHNERLEAGVGDLVKPGEPIATVGRSGWNAARRRSPTHLHLTVLNVAGGGMQPVDVYRNLE